MKFTELPIPGAWLVTMDTVVDERGFFARSFCQEEFRARGMNPLVAQCNVSFNRKRGTLRGMHYQTPPHEEAKLVRCTRGVLFDVIVDVRPGSPSCRRWHGVELSAGNHQAVYVPEGVAHGFLTLVDDCEVFYQMSRAYNPDAAAGVRFDDPALAIDWPQVPIVVSARDRTFPLLEQT